jgi:hypothetical protein
MALAASTRSSLKKAEQFPIEQVCSSLEVEAEEKKQYRLSNLLCKINVA